MMDERRFEAMIREALGRRGVPAPFSIDVADRVMAKIDLIGPAPRAELGLRQFGRWAAAAAIVGFALTAGAFSNAPSFEAVATSFGHTLADATSALLKLAAPAGALAATLGRVVSALVASAGTVVRPLAPFQPLAQAMLAAITAAMLGITAYVVGRDVTRSVAPQERA